MAYRNMSHQFHPQQQHMNIFLSDDPRVADDYIISSLTRMLAENSKRMDKKRSEYIMRMLVIACCSPDVSSAFEKLKKAAEHQLETYREQCIDKSNVQTLLRLFRRFQGRGLAYVARYLTLGYLEKSMKKFNCYPCLIREFYDFSKPYPMKRKGAGCSKKGSPELNMFAALLLARDKARIFNAISGLLKVK